MANLEILLKLSQWFFLFLMLAEANAKLAQEQSNLELLQVGTRLEIITQRRAQLQSAEAQEKEAQAGPQQPEVMRTLYVHRPGRRIIAAFVKPELATGNNLDSLVEKLRSKSNDYPGYCFLVPIRISIFRDPGKEFEVQIIGENLEELNTIQQEVSQQIRGLAGVRNVSYDFVTGAPELQVILTGIKCDSRIERYFCFLS